MRAGAVGPVLVVFYRIDRIKNLAPGLARAGFGERGNELRMIGAGDGQHCVPVGVGSHSGAMFMRRAPCRNEMNFVEMKSSLGGTRHGQVADMNRIECAAKKRDSPLACLFPDNAGWLGGRDAQRSSGCAGAGDSLSCDLCKPADS